MRDLGIEIGRMRFCCGSALLKRNACRILREEKSRQCAHIFGQGCGIECHGQTLHRFAQPSIQ